MPPLVAPAAAPAHSSSTEQEALPGHTAAAPRQDNSQEEASAQARMGATGSAAGVRRRRAPSGAGATEQGCAAGPADCPGGGDAAEGSRPPCHTLGSPGAGGCAEEGSDTTGVVHAVPGQAPPLWLTGRWLPGRGGGAAPRPTPAPGTPAPAPGLTASKAEGSGGGQWVPALGGLGFGLGGVEATTVAATLLGAAAGGAVAGPWGVTAGVCLCPWHVASSFAWIFAWDAHMEMGRPLCPMPGTQAVSCVGACRGQERRHYCSGWGERVWYAPEPPGFSWLRVLTASGTQDAVETVQCDHISKCSSGTRHHVVCLSMTSAEVHDCVASPRAIQS